MSDIRAKMHARVDHRFEVMRRLFDTVHHQIDRGVMGGEEGREWLERHAVGTGINICCGDFPIGESLGADIDIRKLAVDLWAFADRFTHDLPLLDYMVTNYLECFPDPGRVLHEWNQRIRMGGHLAVVCCDSDVYENSTGPLANKRRAHCFTFNTLRFYLSRAGFTVRDWEKKDLELRVLAEKTQDVARRDSSPEK